MRSTRTGTCYTCCVEFRKCAVCWDRGTRTCVTCDVGMAQRPVAWSVLVAACVPIAFTLELHSKFMTPNVFPKSLNPRDSGTSNAQCSASPLLALGAARNQGRTLIAQGAWPSLGLNVKGHQLTSTKVSFSRSAVVQGGLRTGSDFSDPALEPRT